MFIQNGVWTSDGIALLMEHAAEVTRSAIHVVMALPFYKVISRDIEIKLLR